MPIITLRSMKILQAFYSYMEKIFKQNGITRMMVFWICHWFRKLICLTGGHTMMGRDWKARWVLKPFGKNEGAAKLIMNGVVKLIHQQVMVYRLPQNALKYFRKQVWFFLRSPGKVPG